MIALHCSRCGTDLRYPGALIFSPPVNDDVRKMQLCQSCFDEMVGWITGEGGLTCDAEYMRLFGPTAHWLPPAHCSLPFGHEGDHGALLADGTIQYPQPEPRPDKQKVTADVVQGVDLRSDLYPRRKPRRWWRW